VALSNINRSIHVFNLKLFSYVFVELHVFKVGRVVLAGGLRLFSPHCTHYQIYRRLDPLTDPPLPDHVSRG